MRIAVLLGVSATLFAASAGASPALTFATNMPDVRAVVAPPAGFDPAQASNADLAAYGLPPRPDVRRAPEQYRFWLAMMRAHPRRPIPHLVARPPRPPGRRHADHVDGSTNWAGYVFFGLAQQFGTGSFQKVYGAWNVPVVSQAFGVCSGKWQYSVQWVGLDGAASKDVLQAGTEADSDCVSNFSSTFYRSWFEWYPGNLVYIENVPVHPNDRVFVGVWATGPTQGNAYVQNLTQNVATSVQITPPSGTALLGDNAEWILERPMVGKVPATLPHFAPVGFSGWAQDGWGNIFYPGKSYWLTGDDPTDMYSNTGTLLASPTLNRVSAFTVNEASGGG